jgi:MFS family permease
MSGFMPVQKPSGARHWVVFFAVTLSILSYVDRVAISKAAPYIQNDLQLSNTQMGQVFAAFALSYALFEIPTGWLGDYMGAKKVLIRIVLWWSAFTGAVTVMWNMTSLWISRFLFGAGEAGCFPNLTKAFTTWLPAGEKTRAQGIMWMSARWGGAFTPMLCALMFTIMPWRGAFWVFAGLGVIWAYAFYKWFRDDPKDHPGVNAAELHLLAESRKLSGSHGDVPWLRMMAMPSIWLLWAQYFFITYPWYFYITWLSKYLKEGRGVENEITSASYAILPLLFGGFGCLFSGFLLPLISPLLGGLDRTRRIVATIGFIGASACLVLSIRSGDVLFAMLAMAMSSFCNDLVMPCAWGACMDIGGKYAGTLSGSMNMMGNLAGFVAPQVGGVLLDRTGSYDLFLYSMAAVYLLGALCWPFINSTKPLEGAGAH